MDQTADRRPETPKPETDKKRPADDRHEKRPEGPYKDPSDEGSQATMK